jgi:DNA methyltransferase 1-associated protein 1
MTSHDVRDMLDLPGTAGPRPAKKHKVAAPKSTLKGLAREVQSLGGDNPIAIVPQISVFKKRRLASRKPAAKWEHRAFRNSARSDDLILRHWRRKPEVPPAPEGEDEKENESDAQAEEPLDDSIFAKFNVQVQVPQYTDEQYSAHLQNEHWSKDETDYLMGLAQEYDLRWPIIWDRYDYVVPTPEVENGEDAIIPAPKVRSLEDLKARYYRVAAAMMIVHKPQDRMVSSEFALYETMLAFNPAQEIARKKFAENAFQRTREEAKEEESLLLELKRILSRSEKLNEERRELYARLETPPSSGNIGLYSSSQGLQSLLQQLMTVDKSKKRRSLMGPDGASPAPAGPNSLQQGFDRRDSSLRESISGPSGSAVKKGGQGPAERRQLTEEEERTYGVSHPTDRITSGPFFRYEKLSKPVSLKSTAQQAKITNTLNELGLPPRLIMPTAETGASYEILLESIVKMLQFRAVSEKLAGEIAVAKAQKAEREKRDRAARGEPEPEPEPEAETANEEAQPDGEAGSAAAGQEGTDGDGDVKMEEEREKSAAPSARGASVHKRSASVLSTVSDKSTKRQKK